MRLRQPQVPRGGGGSGATRNEAAWTFAIGFYGGLGERVGCRGVPSRRSGNTERDLIVARVRWSSS